MVRISLLLTYTVIKEKLRLLLPETSGQVRLIYLRNKIKAKINPSIYNFYHSVLKSIYGFID